MKIKIISGFETNELEEKVNAFLKTLDENNIISVSPLIDVGNNIVIIITYKES